MAKGSWEPKGYPVRKPTDLKQEIGRIVNPPRTLEVGGRGEAKVFDTEKQKKGHREAGKGPVSDRGKGGR
jgi:hypothetical protein